MKFLIVIFFLVNGEPKGGELIGIAPDLATCQDVGVAALTQNAAAVKQMIEAGVRPQVHCLPAPKFEPSQSRELVVQ
jgi:hypothetical protein